MESQAFDNKEVAEAVGKAVAQISGLMASLDENEINRVPFPDSWTAGQLLQHVRKSINGIAKAVATPGKAADRNPGERIPELKKIFLDFSSKMKSPDFIKPEIGPYEKEDIMEKLNRSFMRFQESANAASLTEIADGLPIGPVTKLEAIHFVLYHTQRHLHQMNRIYDALKSKQ